ncbi:MAG: C45 family autoproteolytic acyltransferase/hydrolase [Kofleriaceae bacterium]
MSKTKPLFLARLAGTQEQMGAQHGRLTAQDAVRLVEFYRAMPEKVLAGGLGKIETFAVRTLANAWQSNLARHRPPEFAARTRAFAEAAARELGDYDTSTAMRTIATMDSLQNCVSLFARGRLGPFAKPMTARTTAAAIPACSTVIVWGKATADGELMFARNFDFPGVGVWDVAPSFVVCAPDKGQRYGFFSARGADAPVVTVVNEAGLVIAPHTRWHSDITWSGAMIVDVIHEIARRAETLADAIAIAKERPASSSWGVAIGSAREKSALVLELAGPHVEVYRAAPGADFLVCNNHYKTASIQRGEFRASHAWSAHSGRREKHLRALVENRSAPLVPRDLARFLGDREDAGVKRQFGGILAQAVNVHCVVVSPAKLRAHVGVDRAPTCEGRWAEVTWHWDGPAGGWEMTSIPADAGFVATALDNFVAPHSRTTDHVHAAAIAYEHRHDIPAARAAIERAVTESPTDPSLRLTAAWLAMQDGAPERAVAHVEVGLTHETDAYRSGQLLLWGSRAARRSDPARSLQWQERLERLTGDGVDELRARLRERSRRKPALNLMMVDAY